MAGSVGPVAGAGSASMGPRSDERGNSVIPVGERPLSVLQWGRAPMSAEIRAQLVGAIKTFAASMGPRSDERGNRRSSRSRIRAAELQWGRAPMSAEIHGTVGVPLAFPTLQWGRAPMSAEITSRVRGRVTRGCRSFNGAALR